MSLSQFVPGAVVFAVVAVALSGKLSTPDVQPAVAPAAKAAAPAQTFEAARKAKLEAQMDAKRTETQMIWACRDLSNYQSFANYNPIDFETMPHDVSDKMMKVRDDCEILYDSGDFTSWRFNHVLKSADQYVCIERPYFDGCHWTEKDKLKFIAHGPQLTQVQFDEMRRQGMANEGRGNGATAVHAMAGQTNDNMAGWQRQRYLNDISDSMIDANKAFWEVNSEFDWWSSQKPVKLESVKGMEKSLVRPAVGCPGFKPGTPRDDIRQRLETEVKEGQCTLFERGRVYVEAVSEKDSVMCIKAIGSIRPCQWSPAYTYPNGKWSLFSDYYKEDAF
jgi:hypothetical protein